jgi:hypothetical protein
MKKVVFVFLAVFSFGASALDVVSDPMLTLQNYMQMLEQYEAAIQQLNTLKRQYEQLQRLEQQTTGSAGLGDLFIGVLMLDDLPDDLSSISDYTRHQPLFFANRSKYPRSTNKYLNGVYDQRAIGETMLQMMYSRSQQRAERAEKLRQAINQQTDPSKKAEMANRLAAETAAIQSDNQKMAGVEKRMDEDMRKAQHEQIKNNICREFRPDPSTCD